MIASQSLWQVFSVAASGHPLPGRAALLAVASAALLLGCGSPAQDAAGTPYDPGANGLQGRSVQAGIDELAAGLQAAAAQAAQDRQALSLRIDAQALQLSALSAGDIGFAPGQTGLAATTVQAALEAMATATSATANGVAQGQSQRAALDERITALEASLTAQNATLEALSAQLSDTAQALAATQSSLDPAQVQCPEGTVDAESSCVDATPREPQPWIIAVGICALEGMHFCSPTEWYLACGNAPTKFGGTELTAEWVGPHELLTLEPCDITGTTPGTTSLPYRCCVDKHALIGTTSD